ncbi:uncharacterized protein LOC124372757 [Homalodisca vitripennis]|uniref:uncharacterized protein LOC124372757 n=1 Tax=Homalodisca vitripennis TaxID=197043 RepID=UPI001EEBFFE6|nr:uncharacterized protein LOC124372757 [Homalodisca vitripennis]
MIGARLQSWELRHPLSCLNVVVYLREVVWAQFFSTCTHKIFLHVCKNSGVHLYADYSQLHLSYAPGNIEEAFLRINSDLERISQWLHDNGLKLNVRKCTVIHLAPHNLVEALSDRGMRVTIGGESLAVCDSVKTLGVVLDRDFTFSNHVSYTIQRAIGRLRGLYRFRDLLPESARLQFMQAFVFSVFYYCYPAYGNSISKGDEERIQKLQN